MLNGLIDEIALHNELNGASKEIVINFLNQDGTAIVESWTNRNDESLKVPKGDMLALLSLESQVKLYDWLKAESDAAKGFSLFFYSHDQFKTCDPVFRGTIELLYNPLSIITESERDSILRLGERKISRAEELFSRKVTMGDFE
jgi:hypothetical protein